MNQWQEIAEHIKNSTGLPFVVKQQRTVGGGSINAAYLLIAENGTQYFVKVNSAGRGDMFAAEADGLKALASAGAIKVPLPVCYGDDGRQSYIVLEHLDMQGAADQRILGAQLAAMHKITAECYGWEIDNTIGATFQPNKQSDNWLDFWSGQRLGFQLQLAANNGYAGELQTLGEKLLQEMPALFDGRDIKASMLHGDLWGGNVAGLPDGTPVIFDPAFYYGDREADIAMTYVFGGFTRDFYASYQDVYPLDAGFAVRKTFYNIYHIINHLNLFGGGYHSQAVRMLQQVLAELA